MFTDMIFVGTIYITDISDRVFYWSIKLFIS